MLRNAAVPLVIFALSVLPCSAHPEHDERPSDGASIESAARTNESRVTISERDGFRFIEANGLPNHATGQFPGRGNPNAIRAQNYHFRVPLAPTANATPTIYDHQPFGVATNGVVFDPFTAGFWKNDRNSGWREAADPIRRNLGIDAARAHVQPNGAYHYHGVPGPLVTDKSKMTLLGWAADGFPIYAPFAPKDPANSRSTIVRLKSSYRLKPGLRRAGAPTGAYDGTYEEDWEYVAGLGDLDECNGRTGPTPEFPRDTYYYVLTEAYPYIPRAFRGTPDRSFERRPHRMGRTPPPDGRP